MASVYKIVFAGPVGSGKTRAVKTLSDIEVVSTEADATDDVKNLKHQTTVAMDYGVMNLANGDKVRLYGTPGQEANFAASPASAGSADVEISRFRQGLP